MAPLAVLLVTSLALRNTPIREAGRTAVAGLLPLVPEGLVLLTSLTFAVAAVRLARLGTLAQRINAIESLASVDVVCLDKTGTLDRQPSSSRGARARGRGRRAWAQSRHRPARGECSGAQRHVAGDPRCRAGGGGNRERRGAVQLRAEMERPHARRARHARARRARRAGGARRLASGSSRQSASAQHAANRRRVVLLAASPRAARGRPAAAGTRRARDRGARGGAARGGHRHHRVPRARGCPDQDHLGGRTGHGAGRRTRSRGARTPSAESPARICPTIPTRSPRWYSATSSSRACARTRSGRWCRRSRARAGTSRWSATA